MVKVKICGLQRKEDIEYVNSHLPDFVGFVFAQSKRRVLPETAAELMERLHPSINRVGIFVNEVVDKVLEVAKMCELDIIQLSGDETCDYVSELRKRLPAAGKSGRKVEVWKAVRVKSGESIKDLDIYGADGILLDTYIDGGYGGFGIAFDWNLAVEACKLGKVILAGGLNPQNVSRAVQCTGPYAVDVSSGVETDGWKDERKIKDFIYEARYNLY